MQLFTLASFATLQGGAFAAVLVPSTVNEIFAGASKRILLMTALAIAELSSFIGASLAGGSGLKWIVAFLNGFVIFAAATGLNQGLFKATGGAGSGPMRGGEPSGSAKRKFIRSWL